MAQATRAAHGPYGPPRIAPRTILALAIAGLVVLGACRPDRLPGESVALTVEERLAAAEAGLVEERPVAWIGDRVLTVEGVERQLETASLLARTWYHEPGHRDDLLATILDIEIMAAAAAGLPDDHPEVRLHAELTAALHLLRSARPDTPVRDEDIDTFLAEDPSRIRVPNHREIVAFSFDDPDAARGFHATLDRAMDLHPHGWRAALRDALERWHDDTPAPPPWTGDLGPVSPAREDVPEWIRRQAFARGELRLHEPVPADDRWAVLWVGIDTPEVDPPEAIVRLRARDRLLRQRSATAARARVEEALQQVTVTRDEARIERLAALRGDTRSIDPDLPRLFDPERLADEPAAVLGRQAAADITRWRQRLGTVEDSRDTLDRWTREEAEPAPDDPPDNGPE
ncbi:MAG: hypothetical protein EA398_13385 [Deltaproteobacteria bacterium]|nr:MAG: hypothetical protein EA398_13385 [Deltaproteobacteria bacterium]